MLRVTLRGLRARKLRLAATTLAVLLGVGFVSGTLIFRDTAKAALFDEFARSGQGVDVIIRPQPDGKPLALTTSDTARTVSGVAAAEGRMTRMVPLLDAGGRLLTGSGGNTTLGISVGTVAELREYNVVGGRAPTGAGEIALDRVTVQRSRYTVGDQVTVLDDADHKRTRTLVGVVDFGTASRYANTAVVVLPQADLTALTGARSYAEVVVRAAPGTSPDELADRLTTAIGGGAWITTGDHFRKELAADAIGNVTGFLTALTLFALISVLVAGFVIYNTFNILIAQRVRESALLRCLGAARAQLFRSVLAEAVVVGLVGAGLGIATGIGVAYALFGGAALLGFPIPIHPPVVTATPVVVALVVGAVVTLLAAFIPAIRATRVAPLAALRSADTPAVSGRRWRIAGAIVTAAAGAALTAYGMHVGATGKTSTATSDATTLVVAGGVTAFLAVLIASPLFVGPLTAALGWLPGRIFRTPAKLAARNAQRHPGRTAATTTALMIGTGLMAASSVLIASLQASATTELDENYPIDYVLEATTPQYVTNDSAPQDDSEQKAKQRQAEPTIPPAVADRLRGERTFSGVAQVRKTEATITSAAGAAVLPAGAVDPAGLDMLHLKTVSGSMQRLAPGTVALSAKFVDQLHLKQPTGEQVTVKTPDGRVRSFTVAAIYSGIDSIGYALFNWDDLAALQPATGDSMLLLRAAGGISPTQARAALDTALANYPLVTVDSAADWRNDITGAVTKIIGTVATLLGFAILIALIGIMNTMSLSVLERTRESAMTRALGLTRGQLRATLLTEALLMACAGAIVGVSFGVLYGLLTTKVLLDHEKTWTLRIPLPHLLGLIALAAAAGALAAVLPARRAGKTSIVSAMAET